jgi:tRNA (guanine-N7-)-methyltransferase
MSRTKQKKFRFIETHPKVIEPSKPNYLNMKGNWGKHFGNTNPIVCEIACGYGEYTNGLAVHFPEKNFIGIDIKGDRIAKGIQESEKNNVKNTAFLRTDISKLRDFFDKEEIDEIWIIHPDPFPQNSNARKRLTHQNFLEMYRNVSRHTAQFHFKTDNKDLYEYSLTSISASNPCSIEFTDNLYSSDLLANHYEIKTRYEKKALKNEQPIYYITWNYQTQVQHQF